MTNQLYSGKAYAKTEDTIATTTNERMLYGSMQRWMNDCFNSDYEKVTVRKQ